MPELTLPHYHADDYLEYHHRILVQQQMEIETETLNRLSSQGPVEEQKEGEDEQGSQDREGLVQPRRQCA